VIVYIIGFAIGLGPVFWLMISEIYPLQFRSKAMATATMFNWGANFIVSFYFLQMTQAIGRGEAFWVYALMGILAMIFFWFKVPETKGRSLEEIENDIGGEELASAVSGSGPLRARNPPPSTLAPSVSPSGGAEPGGTP
jgi:SP family galactose:H+ symporter-like MFS transporter